MKILALDTSTSIAGIAVLEDDKITAELNINNEKKTHSQKLVPLIENVLNEFNFKIQDFDVFAVTTGPGSFTGLRIGITTIKTLAYVFNKPVVGIKTMDVLAYNFPTDEKLICPIIEARNSQVYTAVYENSKNGQNRLTKYEGIHIDELIEKLKNYNRNVIFVGDGVTNNKEYLISKLKNKCVFAPQHLIYQRAATLGIMAYKRFKDNIIENYLDVKPFYLRKSQAERIRDERLEKND